MILLSKTRPSACAKALSQAKDTARFLFTSYQAYLDNIWPFPNTHSTFEGVSWATGEQSEGSNTVDSQSECCTWCYYGKPLQASFCMCECRALTHPTPRPRYPPKRDKKLFHSASFSLPWQMPRPAEELHIAEHQKPHLLSAQYDSGFTAVKTERLSWHLH